MKFKKWVIENYINEDSPKGDFARDMKADKNFPNTRIYDYLIKRGACEGALESYKELREQYKYS